MTIERVTEGQFRDVLRRHFTPARPISSTEYLRGRETKLRQIDRAFNSDGKHIFVHGDRGVGKTSLARTAALIHSTGSIDPPTIECARKCGPFELLGDIALRWQAYIRHFISQPKQSLPALRDALISSILAVVRAVGIEPTLLVGTAF